MPLADLARMLAFGASDVMPTVAVVVTCARLAAAGDGHYRPESHSDQHEQDSEPECARRLSAVGLAGKASGGASLPTGQARARHGGHPLDRLPRGATHRCLEPAVSAGSDGIALLVPHTLLPFDARSRSTKHPMKGPSTHTAFPPCVEHAVWTRVPRPVPASPLVLDLASVDPAENRHAIAEGSLTFQATGCSGCFADRSSQAAVARELAARAADATGRASFLLLLGDIVYKSSDPNDLGADDQSALYDAQFTNMYEAYPRRIFAIAGNHDGKDAPHRHKSAIEHYLDHFCAAPQHGTPQIASSRAPMTQPYVYYRLTTPQAELVNLYSNVANGGILDDPASGHHGAQYRWLVRELAAIGKERGSRATRKAVILTVHYPPYSGASNFRERGDPTLGPTNAHGAVPLGMVLRDAYAESGVRPDLVLSAHNHLYQRLTYRFADGYELPHLIVGSGGHSPIESLFERCDGTLDERRAAPFDAVLPPGLVLPDSDTARVVAFDDSSFGFLRVNVTPPSVAVTFTTTSGDTTSVADSFALDLLAHTIA